MLSTLLGEETVGLLDVCLLNRGAGEYSMHASTWSWVDGVYFGGVETHHTRKRAPDAKVCGRRLFMYYTHGWVADRGKTGVGDHINYCVCARQVGVGMPFLLFFETSNRYCLKGTYRECVGATGLKLGRANGWAG